MNISQLLQQLKIGSRLSQNPGSVVRESELGNAMEASGLAERLRYQDLQSLEPDTALNSPIMKLLNSYKQYNPNSVVRESELGQGGFQNPNYMRPEPRGFDGNLGLFELMKMYGYGGR